MFGCFHVTLCSNLTKSLLIHIYILKKNFFGPINFFSFKYPIEFFWDSIFISKIRIRSNIQFRKICHFSIPVNKSTAIILLGQLWQWISCTILKMAVFLHLKSSHCILYIYRLENSLKKYEYIISCLRKWLKLLQNFYWCRLQ